MLSTHVDISFALQTQSFHYGLVKGYPNNTIRPDDESTRAEAFALPSFKIARAEALRTMHGLSAVRFASRHEKRRF